MRRLSRIDRPIGLLKRQHSARLPSPYRCLACKHQTASFSTSSPRAAPSREKTPFTEKVRQKIWGTDQPPGLDDPYGDGSVFDKTKKGGQKLETREPEPEIAPTEVEETAMKDEEIEDDDTTPGARATTWDGLEWVGGGPVWQPEEQYEGFLRKDRITEPERIVASLHRALVETFALEQAGKPLNELSAHFPVDPFLFIDWTDDVEIVPSSNGATIKMPESTSLQEVMDYVAAPRTNEEDVEDEPTESEEDIDADKSDVDPLRSEQTSSTEKTVVPFESEEGSPLGQTPGKTRHEIVSSWDPSWLQISLQNSEIKFAVLKRTMQLTGIRISDVAIKSSNSVKALLNILIIPPKPKKLFEALEQKTNLSELGNVSIYSKRRGFLSKEQDIGRLKVIKEALEKKGLDLYSRPSKQARQHE